MSPVIVHLLAAEKMQQQSWRLADCFVEHKRQREETLLVGNSHAQCAVASFA